MIRQRMKIASSTNELFNCRKYMETFEVLSWPFAILDKSYGMYLIVITNARHLFFRV